MVNGIERWNPGIVPSVTQDQLSADAISTASSRPPMAEKAQAFFIVPLDRTHCTGTFSTNAA